MTPGNYLEHAVEAFRTSPAVRYGHEDTKKQVETYEHVIPLALKAPRFLLPSGGLLITRDLTHVPKPARLPYPVTVLEYDKSPGPSVAIAMELHDHEDDLCIVVYGFTKFVRDPNNAFWAPEFEVVWIKTEAVSVDHMVHFRVFDLLKGRTLLKPEQLRSDVDQRALRVLSLIQALACSNVEIRAIPAPSTLNKKRIANKKLPFVEYKVLMLGNERGSSVSQNGHHAPPRQHLRRGHIRRLPDTRTIWVNQCLVGDPRKGSIVKDYRVLA